MKKEIPGYDGLYEVTDSGELYSMDRFVKNGDKLMFLKGKQRKSVKNEWGYLRTALCKNGVLKSFFIHRLVAMAFIPNPLNLAEVNHKNGIRNDNRVENLEWVSQHDNILHSWKRLNRTIGNKGKLNSTSQKMVNQIDCSTNEIINTFLSSSDAARHLGKGRFASTYISDFARGKNGIKTAYGFSWKRNV